MAEDQELEATEGEGRLRPFWSGTISFGLVSVPVDLYPANRSKRVSLRMLSPEGAIASCFGQAPCRTEALIPQPGLGAPPTYSWNFLLRVQL